MIYVAIGILSIFIILIWTGKKSVHNEIIINASNEKVWKTIVQMDEYPKWNPVMKLIKGKVQEGQKVKYQFTQDEKNIIEIEASVIELTPNKVLNQKGGVPLILTFNHSYILEQVGQSTKVVIHEDYNGIGVNFWNPKPVEEAYKQLNIAIKKRTERN